MTPAIILILNLAAAAIVLTILAATMRLSFKLPASPRSGRVETKAKDRAPSGPLAWPVGRRSSERRDVPEPIYSP